MANSHASPAQAHGHAHHSPEEMKKHRKVYFLIFFALLIGTVVTVALYSIHFSQFWVTVTIALFVATVKATLVACYFMHLISERKAIYSTLTITAFFFAAMLYLIIWARVSVPKGTEYTPSKYVPVPMTAPAP